MVLGEKLNLVNNAVRKVATQMHISDAQDSIWTLQREYRLALNFAGYGDLPDTKPHIAIQHIIKRLDPNDLKSRMMDIVHGKKNKHFHKEYFNRIMREVALQVENVQYAQTTMSNNDTERVLGEWRPHSCTTQREKAFKTKTVGMQSGGQIQSTKRKR